MPDKNPLPDMVPDRRPPADLSAVVHLPQRERPFACEDEKELKYELAIRIGPFCRCGYCGYLPDYRVDLLQRPQCPVCRRTGTLARWRRWAPAQISACPKANDWARRVAEGLKLCWPKTEGGRN